VKLLTRYTTAVIVLEKTGVSIFSSKGLRYRTSKTSTDWRLSHVERLQRRLQIRPNQQHTI